MSSIVGPEEVWQNRIRHATPPMSEGEWNQPINSQQKTRIFQHDKWEKKQVPIDSIKLDGNHPSKPLNEEDEPHAHKYSALNTPAPPITLHHDGKGGFDAIDGRHRTRAAYLRGQTHVEAYVPVEDTKKSMNNVKKAKKIMEIAKEKAMAKIGQLTHAMEPQSKVGQDAVAKDLEPLMGTQSIDNGGIRSFNDRKQEEEKRQMLKEIPEKHRKAFEKAMDDKDPAKSVLDKIKFLKNKIKW